MLQTTGQQWQGFRDQVEFIHADALAAVSGDGQRVSLSRDGEELNVEKAWWKTTL